MRLGILTFHYADNYGAVLQAYGLQQKLREMGHDVRILNFRYNPRRKIVLAVKCAIAGCLDVLRFGRTRGEVLSLNRSLFSEFRTEHLVLSQKLEVDQLSSVVGEYDCLLVGSDQVWNADFWTDPRTAYFLDFCREESGLRKVSYATCFGQTNQPRWFLEKLDGWLDNFDHISVRGAGGCELVHAHTHHRPTDVLDPTLLWDFDGVMSSPLPHGGCILVYSLSRHVAPCIRAAIDMINRDDPKRVVSISSKAQYPFADQYLEGIGPSEFVRLIHDAGYVCTDSYHGTLFAIKHRKPFVTCSNGPRAMRIKDVLSSCGIEERLISCAADVVPEHVSADTIDYDAVHERIDDMIEESIKFLERALA